MSASGLLAQPILRIGSFAVSESAATATGLTIALAGAAAWARSRLRLRDPAGWQVVLELAVQSIDSTVRDSIPKAPERVLPLVGTLWIYILFANLVGLIPGLHSPTGDLSVTGALAAIVFFAVPYYGVRAEGWVAYLREYFTPMFWMFPFHVMSELTRTLTLAVRLFGNMTGMEVAIGILLLLAGFLVPVAFLFLHLIEALLQAYIFGMLALVYIAGGMQALADREQQTGGTRR
ncbi:F-type H+-transporting ATPase subunit a [Methylacidimicrobium cyclopophantes]|uniref:ATP synthase subunit a n=1 Tax=Methylacidimicrobium cyclopophantes TaxID=1041766 RepID=A0A5E6MAD7_9BACT|nr:F0F1 ATP synthase subunit A [Methylacidimicrobium cyclopophantes]VVM05929.1 F-type H+-transporting ATPase subunit a [Methylacidimicrobium cyclopophantes]